MCAFRRSPLAAALLVGITLLAGCGRAGTPARYHGLSPQPAPPRPAFTLVDTAGHTFRFPAATHGQPTLLYFGYTHCPDECPTTMADIASALAQAPRRVAERVRVVFVTTDPARDTGPVLRQWLDRFDRSLPAPFVGLVGTSAQVAAAERSAGVPVADAVRLPHGGYAVNHAALVLAYAVDDRAHVLYPAGTSVPTYAQDLPQLLNKRQPTA